MSRPAADLQGRLFGRWLVVTRVGTSSSGSALWRCLCVCGARRDIPTNNLTLGRSTSCGRAGKCARHGPAKTGVTKLTVSQVQEIRRLRALGQSWHAISRELDVPTSTARNVITGNSWSRTP